MSSYYGVLSPTIVNELCPEVTNRDEKIERELSLNIVYRLKADIVKNELLLHVQFCWLASTPSLVGALTET